MSLITGVLDWLALLTEPFWLTLFALAGMIEQAGAGTALFAGFVLLLALDFLRSSKGQFVPVARVAAIASSLFFIATFIYGDFLAGPAKAAYSAIVARSESVPPNVVVLTTLGAAGAGAFYLAGGRRLTLPRTAPTQHRPAYMHASARRETSVAALGQGLSLDAAGRLQLRQMSRNSKVAVNAVRPAARGMTASPVAMRGGRRTARFDRV